MVSIDIEPADIHSVAPAAKPDLAANLDDFVKVRLSYQTLEPQHIRSTLLYHLCNILPPYTEEVFILLPQMKVFALLEAFLPSFEYLQKSGVISKTAELQGFTLLPEDDTTLSYIFSKK